MFIFIQLKNFVSNMPNIKNRSKTSIIIEGAYREPSKMIQK